MSDLITGGLGGDLITQGLGEGGIVVATSVSIPPQYLLYYYHTTSNAETVGASVLTEPFSLKIANGADVFFVRTGEDNRVLEIDAADADAQTDWSDPDHTLTNATVYIVSVNKTQIQENAVIVKAALPSENIDATIAGKVTLTVILTAADIAAMDGYIFYAYAVLTLSSGETVIIGNVRIEKD
jgi:hypothetical protein